MKKESRRAERTGQKPAGLKSSSPRKRSESAPRSGAGETPFGGGRNERMGKKSDSPRGTSSRKRSEGFSREDRPFKGSAYPKTGRKESRDANQPGRKFEGSLPDRESDKRPFRGSAKPYGQPGHKFEDSLPDHESGYRRSFGDKDREKRPGGYQAEYPVRDRFARPGKKSGFQEDKPAYGKPRESETSRESSPALGKKDFRPAYRSESSREDLSAYEKKGRKTSQSEEPEVEEKPLRKPGERDGWFIEETDDRKNYSPQEWESLDWDDDEDEEERPENQVIYGRNPVMEAVKSQSPLNKVYIQKEISGDYFKKLLAALRLRDIPFTLVDKVTLDRITNRGVHQGVAAMGSAHSYIPFDKLVKKAGRADNPLLLVLSQVYDPHNLGSLLRSAEGAGVAGVVIPRRNSCGLTPVVAKTSAGGIEYVPVARVNNISNALDQLREEGYNIVGVESQGTVDYTKADYRGMTVLLMGGEDKALTPHLLKRCHQVVKIKMAGKLSSLNLSVAGAVVLFEAAKQKAGNEK